MKTRKVEEFNFFIYKGQVITFVWFLLFPVVFMNIKSAALVVRPGAHFHDPDQKHVWASVIG